MAQTRFTPDLDLDGLSPDDAFAILGNDIRLEIIRVLWSADAAYEYDDGADTARTMSYSALQTEVDVGDNGKFNYHLSQLSPHFIRQTDNGYRLSGAGKQIARTVIAISGAESVDFSTELETDCPLCGASVAAFYEDHWLRIRCTECDGLFGDHAPEGTLFLTTFPAAGLKSRGAERALSAGLYRCALDITYLMYGICRECAGPISSSLSRCDAHDPRGNEPCPNCGTPFAIWADMRCETCGFAKQLPVEMFATGLSMATGVIDNQAIDMHSIAFDEAIDLLQNRVETRVSKDPLRISVIIKGETKAFTVTLNNDMDVVDFEQKPSA